MMTDINSVRCNEPEGIEARHVHRVYAQIASHFSDTRYKPWPRVVQFLQHLPLGSLVADVGCGNGKYFPMSCTHGYMIGCDMCSELLSIAASRGHEVAIADCLNLPYRSNSFDAVISIAVIHHLSNWSRRVQAIGELVRVVGEGGRVLVYVWAMEQQRKQFTAQDVMVPWHMQPRYTSSSRGHSEMDVTEKKKKMNKKQRALRKKESSQKSHPGDGEEGTSLPTCSVTMREECSQETLSGHVTSKSDHMTPRDQKSHREEECCASPSAKGVLDDNEPHVTSNSNHMTPSLIGHVTSNSDHMTPSLKAQGFQTFQRFYHVFKKSELSALFNEVGGVRILEEFYDHENWCVVAEKIT